MSPAMTNALPHGPFATMAQATIEIMRDRPGTMMQLRTISPIRLTEKPRPTPVLSSHTRFETWT